MCDQPSTLVGSVWRFQTTSRLASEWINISGRHWKQAMRFKSHCSDKTKQEQCRILINGKKVDDGTIPWWMWSHTHFNKCNCEPNRNDLRTTFSAVWPAGVGGGTLAQVRPRNGGAVGRWWGPRNLLHRCVWFPNTPKWTLQIMGNC